MTLNEMCLRDTQLLTIVYPTTERPPNHSANNPPGNDVTKYPQKYDPNK